MFESFWGSAASMELNARQTSIANQATRVAGEWKAYAHQLEGTNASLQAEIAALKKQLSSAQADTRMLRSALQSLSSREREYA